MLYTYKLPAQEYKLSMIEGKPVVKSSLDDIIGLGLEFTGVIAELDGKYAPLLQIAQKGHPEEVSSVKCLGDGKRNKHITPNLGRAVLYLLELGIKNVLFVDCNEGSDDMKDSKASREAFEALMAENSGGKPSNEVKTPSEEPQAVKSSTKPTTTAKKGA